MGPRVEFTDARTVAVTGAEMALTLNGAPVPRWESFRVKGGDVLKLGAAKTGVRAYLAIGGGIDTPRGSGFPRDLSPRSTGRPRPREGRSAAARPGHRRSRPGASDPSASARLLDRARGPGRPRTTGRPLHRARHRGLSRGAVRDDAAERPDGRPAARPGHRACPRSRHHLGRRAAGRHPGRGRRPAHRPSRSTGNPPAGTRRSPPSARSTSGASASSSPASACGSAGSTRRRRTASSSARRERLDTAIEARLRRPP